MRRGKIERIEFVPFGPFRLPRLNQKKIDATARARFWRRIDARHPGLSRAVGCYVFAITASKGTLPWYIGRTTTAPFARETWSARRLAQYQSILRRRRQGTPILLLVAKRSPGGGFAKPSQSGQAAIDLLRDLVLESALLRNRRLHNRRDTRHLQGISMSGFINAKPGRPTDAARHLAQVLRRD